MARREILHELSDEQIVARCRLGDKEALQTLFARHSPQVYTMALRLTGSVADAEDVLQDTFLRAFRFFGSFRAESSIQTWLCRIAINLSRDLYKKRGPTQSEENVEASGAASSSDILKRRQLLQALDKLPEGYREVLVMHDVMEMEHNEIAQVLGVAQGTSKSQLHKARANMRSLLTAGGVAS